MKTKVGLASSICCFGIAVCFPWSATAAATETATAAETETITTSGSVEDHAKSNSESHLQSCPYTTANGITSTPSSKLASASMGSSEGRNGSNGTNSSTSSDSPVDDVQTMNQSFRKSYAEAKKQIKEKLGPIILVNGDRAILLKNGSRTEAAIIPEEYHLTKSVDHIALDIFVILSNETNKPLDDSAKHDLQNLRELVLKAQPQVDKFSLSTAEHIRQKQIIDRSLTFIDETLKSGSVSHEELQTFTRGIAKLTLANVDEGIAAATAKCDEVIQGWRKSMTESEWAKLHVIVVSGHMPRLRNSAMQYFQLLLHQKQEGDRVIYFEGNYNEEQAIDLLVTHILDRSIAVYFYKDPWRMHRDLLSDGAHKYLKKHPPKG